MKEKGFGYYLWREDSASWTSVWDGGGSMNRHMASSSPSWWVVVVVVVVLLVKEFKMEKWLLFRWEEEEENEKGVIDFGL
jgi:hypothetical protein